MEALAVVPTARSFELRYDWLMKPGRSFVFPCDARGRVDLDTLGDRRRASYLYVRALVGRDFAMPVVQLEPGVQSGRHEAPRPLRPGRG